jgi:protein-serine/threonine kinase
MELVENKFYRSDSKKSASDFDKIKLLGKGGVGHVYLVRLKHTNEYYAMKVLTKDEMIRQNKVKRVLTEREILATADNPFIVNLYYL